MFEHLYNRPLSQEELDVLAVIDRLSPAGMVSFGVGSIEERTQLQAQGIVSRAGVGLAESISCCAEGIEAGEKPGLDRGDA